MIKEQFIAQEDALNNLAGADFLPQGE